MDENKFSSDVFDDLIALFHFSPTDGRQYEDPNSLMNLGLRAERNPPFNAHATDGQVVMHMEITPQVNSYSNGNQLTYVNCNYSIDTIVEDGSFSQPTQKNENFDEGLTFDMPCSTYPSESFDWLFGTEVQPTILNTPMSCPNYNDDECEIVSIKKPKPNRDIFDRNNWLITDENGKARKPLLHEYLRLLLTNENYAHIAKFIDRRRGIFRFVDREKAAQLWGLVKGRNGVSEMTYDKLARAVRMYYPNKVMSRTPGRYTFRFDYGSGFGVTWN